MKKSCTAYSHLDALQGKTRFTIYLVLTKEMAQKWHLWPGATKINLKNLKILL